MYLKHILITSSAALALAVGSIALAGQPKTPMVSGDEPMNVGQSAEIKAPSAGVNAQEKTEKMLNKESGDIYGSYPNERGGLEKEVKNPVPNAKEQEATKRQLHKEDRQSGAISGKYD